MDKKQTLADTISSILSTTPASFHPDENEADTVAKVTEGALPEDDIDDVLLSDFRKKNVEILEEVDVKYAGKRGSRRNLKDSDDEWETEESDADGEGEGESEDDDPEGSNDEESDAAGDGDESGSEGAEEEETENEEGMSIDEQDEDFRHMTEQNVSSQMRKGLCVRNQLNVWEHLLEMRIQMQKCLIAANKMPQKDYYKMILEESGEDFRSKVKETKHTLSNTLNKLLELQTVVWKKYPETKNLLKFVSDKKTKKKEGIGSEDEVPSDTDPENSESEVEEEDEETKSKRPKKRIRLSDFEEDLDERHKRYKDYRNTVIQKWNEKTRIGSSKSNLQHSVLNQIDHILSDRARLIKRTQTKRSNYEIIGTKRADADSDESKLPQERNSEIFDDDDFYHQLLRELIEVKSADVTDPVQLGRQWIQLQNLRSKMKRKIDTRATKGRKIRYTVHAKLVNFMAPIDEGTYTEEAKTELFSSLGGKNKPVHRL